MAHPHATFATDGAELWHMVSVSGGKDSTATALLARERGIDAVLVFADTQHEHPLTYEYIAYLDKEIGPIRTVKSDFARLMAGKRAYIEKHWFDDLTTGRNGRWQWLSGLEPPQEPPPPSNQYATQYLDGGRWKWICAIRPWSADRARSHISEALAALQPTGNAFLDLCLWKGRFPSTRRRFCSEELKHNPIREQVVEPIQADGLTVVSWQGVRAEESKSRARLCIVDQPEEQLIQYRPIIAWTAADVFAMHRKCGVKWNPLYELGMGRVGCMPCIHANKRELAEIARRFPDVINRIEAWERRVSEASKWGISTFGDVRKFAAYGCFDYANIDLAKHGIRAFVRWANTTRGGNIKQDSFDFDEALPACSSIYGLCESAQ